MTTSHLPAVSIIVLSYDRVHLLERTLRACLDQRVPNGMNYEIIVGDNHPDQLAKDLVRRLAAEATVPLRYTANAERNISVMRNAAVRAAAGKAIAFVDDDEAPEAEWLANLYQCLERTGADAVFGPKYPEFEIGHAPDWDREGWYFTLDFRQPADSPIAMFGRLRRKGKGLGTGNSMFRVATCLSDEEPFKVSFGNAGGEDTELLFRLAREGRRFVWCPTARVREYIMQTRTSIDYIRTRLMRGSQHYASSRIANSNNRRLTQMKVMIIGLGQILVHGGLYALSGEFLSDQRIRNRIGIAKGLGKLNHGDPIGFIQERR